jgi:predicted nucleic acid-binding protein
LAEPKSVYWDSCVWLRLINGEPGADRCQAVLERAQRNELSIWTSSLTLAEVYKFKCDGPKALAIEQDQIFEAYISSDFVVEVQVDHAIATLSRRLCREHPPLKKPNDGVHLATAVISNVDEFHTFDADDLLVLSGKVRRQDGAILVMCEPYIVGAETIPLLSGPA